MAQKANFQVNKDGYYGKYGGAFVSELLLPNVEELQAVYRKIIDSATFRAQYEHLLQHYVGRPTPLYFAPTLSQHIGAQIYLKREDLNHTGAHKINNTIGQALVAKQMGKERIIAETGAGQHGVATATVCALMQMECIIFMGQKDMQRQRSNVDKMHMLGAKIVPVRQGTQTLKDATSEAIRHWINHAQTTYYLLGSVVGPHPYPDMVAHFQSIISKEIRQQLYSQIGTESPDYILACVGGGSNAAGAFFHYLDDEKVKLIAFEAAGKGLHTDRSAATIALGSLGILHGSRSKIMQNEDGQILDPHSIAAGLDYPGIGPLHAHLHDCERVTFHAIDDQKAYEAGCRLARMEGIIPALESAHAIAGLQSLNFDKNDVIVVNLSGRGDKDIHTYSNYE